MAAPSQASQHRKLRAACDQCHASKLKCSGGGPPCKRCDAVAHPCHYSVAARMGKPPGSKNRKTLERLRRATTGGDLENRSVISTADSHPPVEDRPNGAPQRASRNINNSDDADGDGEEDSDQIQPIFHPLPSSPSRPRLDPLGRSHPIQTTNSRIPTFVQNDDLDMQLDSGGAAEADLLLSPDFSVPDQFFDPVGAPSFEPAWMEDQQGVWNSGVLNSSLHTTSLRASSSSSESCNGFPHRTFTPASLDSVAARLEGISEPARGSITDVLSSSSISCMCMRKHTDTLCKLQAIEKRQSPVQADTVIACTNLVLGIAESYFRCPDCADDPGILTQLILVFQTIFKWAQGQRHPPGSSCPDLPVILGGYQMPAQEALFIRFNLLKRLVERCQAITNAFSSRVDKIVRNRQGRQMEPQEITEIKILQQLSTALLQSSRAFAKRLEDKRRTLST